MRGLADLVDEQPEINMVGPSSDDSASEEGDSASESSDEEDEEQPIVHGEMQQVLANHQWRCGCARSP